MYNPAGRLLSRDFNLPLSDELRRRLFDLVKPFYLSDRQIEKRSIELSEAELKRQAHIINDLMKHGHITTALGSMREWTVSWAVWNEKLDTHWLDYRPTRIRASTALGGLLGAFQDPTLRDMLSEDQRDLAEFWDTLAGLRNGYNHHGMRPQMLIGDKSADIGIEKVREYWDSTLSCLPNISLSVGDSSVGRVLVSPVGLRPACCSARRAGRRKRVDV